MSKLFRGIVLAGSCAAMAAALPAVAQKPSTASSANTCETLCYQRHGACINAGTSELICDRQLVACLDKCR